MNASSRIYCTGLTRNNAAPRCDDHSKAAESDRPIVVILEGPLVEEDEHQFATKTASIPAAFVALSSDCGSLAAGLGIAEAVRRKGFSTIVPDGRSCASSCAFAWLGGIERFRVTMPESVFMLLPIQLLTERGASSHI
jgi:hypothetical protein